MQYVKMVTGTAGYLWTESKHDVNIVYVALVRSFVEKRWINLLAFSSKTFCFCVFQRTRPLNVLSQIFLLVLEVCCASANATGKGLFLHQQVMQTNRW